MSEKLNEETNRMELRLDYGIWYKGWLEEQPEGPGALFKIHIESDLPQGDYAFGIPGDEYYAMFDNGTMTLIQKIPMEEDMVLGRFKHGLRSGDLPPVPWEPDSCGPEAM